MAWEFPNAPGGSAYPRPDPNVLGNALANLVSSYQGAQQGEQQTEANQKRLDLLKVFSGGVPMKDGVPDMAAVVQARGKAGDPYAPESLYPLIQQQQWQQSAKLSPALGDSSGGFMGSLHQVESGNQNKFSDVDKDYPGQPGSRSQGYDQIDVPTWQQFAPRAGVDINQYPTPMSDPTGVIQDKVAAVIPFERFGPRTRAALEKQYGFTEADKHLTVGQLAAKYGGGVSPQATAFPPTQVASLGPVAVPDPNKPTIPPGSASAPDLPRSTAPTAGAGQPSPQPWATGPAMQGINAALPVQAGLAGPAGAAPAPAGATVAGMVSSVVQDPRVSLQVAANVASALHVDPRAPLTPEQAARAKTIIQNYAARTRQQPPASIGQGQQPAAQGQPLVPQFPLPYGLKPGQEMQAVMRLNRDIADIARRGNPYEQKQIPELEFIRDGILKQITPIPGRVGEMFLSPQTSQPIAQVPYPSMSSEGGGLDAMAENVYQTGKMPTGLSRTQGLGKAIWDRAVELHPEDPVAQWPARQQAFGANVSGERTLSTRTALFTMAENEASLLVPRVRQILPKLDHTKYTTLNAAINAYAKETGDPTIIKLGISTESLARVYARALNPQGAPTVDDFREARALIDKRWSEGGLEAALDQIDLELSSTRNAIDITRQEFGLPPLNEVSGGTGAVGGGGANQGGGASGVTSTGVPWSVK